MKCGCSDSIDPGKFDQKLIIQENAVTTQNTDGEIVPAWTPISGVSEIWASIEQGTGRELFAAQQIRPEVNSIVKSRYRSDLTPRHRFKVKGTSRVIEILGMGDPDGSRRYLVFQCKENQ